jgi:hypothetical protein
MVGGIAGRAVNNSFYNSGSSAAEQYNYVFDSRAMAVDGAVGAVGGGVGYGLGRIPSSGGGRTTGRVSAEQLNQRPLYRVMTEPEVNAVRQTGHLRGGSSGDTYFTDSYFRSASNAQNRLSLQHRPTHIMEFEIVNNPRIMGGNTVMPAHGGVGGGREFYALDPVEVRIINIQRMGQ